MLATPKMLRTFRLPDRPKPLAEVADRFHLTPLIRAMTSPHDAFLLALSEERVRLIYAFVTLPPIRVPVAGLPARRRSGDKAARRSMFVRRAAISRIWKGRRILLDKYVRKVVEALHGALAGQARPLILAADKPLASMFRSLNGYPRLVDEVIVGQSGPCDRRRTCGRCAADPQPALLP